MEVVGLCCYYTLMSGPCNHYARGHVICISYIT